MWLGLNRAAYWQPMDRQRLGPGLSTIGRPKSKGEGQSILAAFDVTGQRAAGQHQCQSGSQSFLATPDLSN